jgi:hypothetical protein
LLGDLSHTVTGMNQASSDRGPGFSAPVTDWPPLPLYPLFPLNMNPSPELPLASKPTGRAVARSILTF